MRDVKVLSEVSARLSSETLPEPDGDWRGEVCVMSEGRLLLETASCLNIAIEFGRAGLKARRNG